ncbi:MAG: hypothetical protein WDM89_07840 [Rhizomicrobium sp.]
MIPGAIPGKDIHDLISAKCDYAKLDRPDNAVRIRLNNLAVRARNVGKGVEIAYSASTGGGKVYKVSAKDCVMAGWNMLIPYIVPDLPDVQKAALHALVKSPLVYCNVALKNWKAFHATGVTRVMVPSGYFSVFNLSQPVNMGAYKMPRTPDEPMVIRMLRTPGAVGMSEDDQARMGRMELLQTPFETSRKTCARSWAGCLARTVLTPRPTSPASWSTAGRMAMRRNTTRCGTRTTMPRLGRISPHASVSAASRSRIPTAAWVRIPMSPSIKPGVP